MNRYPLWKYLVLAGLLAVAIIYALPNLYGQDPSIQVSGIDGNKVTNATEASIEKVLKSHNLPFKSADIEGKSLLIRFSDPDIQLKAHDYVKAEVGQKYAVALSLASRTPHWLEAIGASPVHLGLDLRGGVYFLLKVETEFSIKARQKGDMHSMAKELREKGIRYTSIALKEPQGISIRFASANKLTEGWKLIRPMYRGYVFRMINQGRIHELRIMLAESTINQIQTYAVNQAMTILRNRVNALGTSEAVVQRQGVDNISVALPGVQDTARAKQLIGKTATVQFKLVDDKHDLEDAVNGNIPLGSQLYKMREGNYPILLTEETILEGSSITYASAGFDEFGNPAVDIRLGGGGESRFHHVTSNNVGKRLAVVYVETQPVKVMRNGKAVTEYRQKRDVISAPVVNQALGNRFQIQGLESSEVARNLALLLRSGALKAPVDYVQEQTIGPSLGQENIDKGLQSLFYGALFIVIFMFIYYRTFGLFTNIAQVLNIIFIVAILSIIGATLTLPGIAGIVLTVGMAVDANVLINERIREELRNGVTPQAAIYAGYERAFSTIIDANVTTLIVAVVLFALGTGTVKGFAVTVIIGIMTSLLTSIYYTRALVNLTYGNRSVKNLSIGMKLPSKDK